MQEEEEVKGWKTFSVSVCFFSSSFELLEGKSEFYHYHLLQLQRMECIRIHPSSALIHIKTFG